MKTIQEKMKEKLEQAGIPAKEIKVYGSQIMITAYSYDAACKWAELLFPIVRKRTDGSAWLHVGESIDYAKDNKQTCLNSSTVRVWRVWGTV